jgi:hypothetical protein
VQERRGKAERDGDGRRQERGHSPITGMTPGESEQHRRVYSTVDRTAQDEGSESAGFRLC